MKIKNDSRQVLSGVVGDTPYTIKPGETADVPVALAKIWIARIFLDRPRRSDPAHDTTPEAPSVPQQKEDIPSDVADKPEDTTPETQTELLPTDSASSEKGEKEGKKK